MLRQILDLFGQDSDLNLWGTGVCGMRLKLLNNALLLVDIEHVIVGYERPLRIQ